MLTLGRTLAMKPKVLLVDELSVGLAPSAGDADDSDALWESYVS